MKEHLTPAEHEFVLWLQANEDALEYSVAEIATTLGKAKSRIYQLLKALEEKGHIKREVRQTFVHEQTIRLL